MRVDLIDGTYELFRHHFAVPPAEDAQGRPIGAIRGVLESMLNLLSEPGCTHIAIATDHVIESFRNDLYPGYKTGEGIEPELVEQFHPLEEALRALGFVVWAMEEHEADDALASGAAIASSDERVELVRVCTPDKDLAQCVVGNRVVQVDRRRRLTFGAEEVKAKFGVAPESIPDYLGLVGDTADGYPGLPGWGAKSAAAILSRYGHYEQVPQDHRAWECDVRGAAKLAETFITKRWEADLYRLLATLRLDAVTLPGGVNDLKWNGPTPDLAGWAETLRMPNLVARTEHIWSRLDR